MHLRPLFAALGLVALATLLEPVLPGTLPPLALVILSVLGALTGVFSLRKYPALGILSLLLCVFCLGLLRARDARLPRTGDPSERIGQRVTLIGVVAEPPERGARGSVHFTLTTEAGRVWCRLKSAPGPALGERVEVRGKLEAPPAATNPGQFDWRAHLARQGTRSLLLAQSCRTLAPPGPLARLLSTLRGGVQSATGRYLTPEDAALLDGLLLSVRSELPADLDDAFQRTGTVHILSVSGLHLAALGAFLSSVLTQVLPTRRGVRVGITLGFVWIFALAVGASPAALRSAVMLSVVLLAPILKRDAEPLHSLALAALLILLQNPQALLDPGTQLSFAACAGLILFLPPLEALLLPWEPDHSRLTQAMRWLLLGMTASLIAHLATWPLVAVHFHVFSIISPLANVPLAALSEMLLLAGLLAIVCGYLPLVGPLWWGLIGWGLRLLRWLARSLASVPYAAVSVADVSLWVVLAYYGLFLGAAFYVRPLARRRLFAPVPWESAFRLPPRPDGATGDVS